MHYIQYYESPLGRILLSCDERGLNGLWFTGQKYFASTLAADYAERETHALAEAKRWLDLYFKGINPDFTPLLSIHATEFRKTVWEILLTIPYGQTMGYGQIAKRISENRNGVPTSPRAVGGAVGHNPISLIIPCHRVIGADGNLTGYAGGTDKKEKLLALERTVNQPAPSISFPHNFPKASKK